MLSGRHCGQAAVPGCSAPWWAGIGTRMLSTVMGRQWCWDAQHRGGEAVASGCLVPRWAGSGTRMLSAVMGRRWYQDAQHRGGQVVVPRCSAPWRAGSSTGMLSTGVGPAAGQGAGLCTCLRMMKSRWQRRVPVPSSPEPGSGETITPPYGAPMEGRRVPGLGTPVACSPLPQGFSLAGTCSRGGSGERSESGVWKTFP